jgi:DNA-binding transcriptional regulator YiaG
MSPDTLRAMRATLGLTQSALADYLSLSTRQIKRYESGSTPIPGALARLISILIDGKKPRLPRPKPS